MHIDLLTVTLFHDPSKNQNKFHLFILSLQYCTIKFYLITVSICILLVNDSLHKFKSFYSIVDDLISHEHCGYRNIP